MAIRPGVHARVACAIVLLVAAALKGHQLATDSTLWLADGSRWLDPVLVMYELTLAAWLLSGVGPRKCRAIAIVTFLAFGCYAAYQGMWGTASCGCFGKIHVNPWWALSLDLAVIAALWSWKPAPSRDRGRAAGPTISLASSAMFGGIAMIALSSVTIGRTSSDVQVLEPRNWIGKPFELARDISDGRGLLNGRWVVVLYHHGCSRCRKLLLEYKRLAVESKNDGDAFQIAVVEVPPYGKDVGRGFQYHRLSDRKKWFVVTPTEVRIVNGTVMAVSVDQRTAFSSTR